MYKACERRDFHPLSVWSQSYCKNPKILDTQQFAIITLKVEQDGFSLE